MKQLFTVFLILINSIAAFSQTSDSPMIDRSRSILLSQSYDTSYIVHIPDNHLCIGRIESHYLCDGDSCNGNKISFWKNGNTHIRGKFIDGQPYDTLQVFKEDGTLESLTIDDTTWYFNSSGIIFRSKQGAYVTLYNEKGIRYKTIYAPGPPASSREDFILYDSLGNTAISVTSYSSIELQKVNLFESRKKYKGYSALYLVVLPIDQNNNEFFVLDQNEYESGPKSTEEIKAKSIILHIYKVNDDVFMKTGEKVKKLKSKRE